MKQFTIGLGLALAFSATPTFACGMMQTTATQATGAASSTVAPTAGGMCGRPAPAGTQAQPGQATAGGGCSCCRNMAMMQPQPGQPGGMPGMGGMDHQMPGMQTPPSAPPAPPGGSPAPNN